MAKRFNNARKTKVKSNRRLTEFEVSQRQKADRFIQEAAEKKKEGKDEVQQSC